jgi:hypothetical protein
MQNKKEDALSKGDTSGAKSISDMQKKLMHSSDARSDQSTLDTSRSRSRQRESAKAATDALKPSTRAIANQPSRNVYNGSRANMGYGGRRRVAMNKGGLARATQGYMCGGMAHKGKKK